nr:ribonuclease H-like domain-containing protein [Tanacetum cinerariifolium]
MVNTRTDTDLSAAVQNALQALLPQIREEIREEFRTGSGSSNASGNPPTSSSGLRRYFRYAIFHYSCYLCYALYYIRSLSVMLSRISFHVLIRQPNPNPVPVHPIVTHFCIRINRPTQRLTLHVSSISPLLKSYNDAFNDRNSQNAMLFRHMYLADGTLSRHKAGLVANGSMQLKGIDVDETFSSVVKPSTIWTEFSMTYLGSLNYFFRLIWLIEILIGLLLILSVNLEMMVCLYMHDPREPNFLALERILRYVRGTLDYGLQLFSYSTTSLVAYSDVNLAGCLTTRRSTSEAECLRVANAISKTCWLRNLLRLLHILLSSATLVYCDNVSAVYLSSNVVHHQCTKHIEIDIHYVRDLVVVGHVRVLHGPLRYQYADIFTKGLPSALIEEFRTSLSVLCDPASTAVEC